MGNPASDRRFFALILLDGWGLNPNRAHNAVALAETPTMDAIWSAYPHTTLSASGRSVGLPEGLMGNSEVGHLNLGAGRVVLQAVTQIDSRVRDGSLFANPALTASIDRLLGTDRRLHLIGLVSDGGVHAWPGHYEGLLKMAAARGLNKAQVYVHAFLDGRDTPPKSGWSHLRDLLATCERIGLGRVATICGRYYGMDRDRRWDRTRLAYDCLTNGLGRPERDPLEAIQSAYARSETDEFIKPVVIRQEAGGPVATVKNGDSVIFFNFRSDRPRQIAEAFLLDAFEGFERNVRPKVHFTCLTRYEEGLPADGVAFPPETLEQEMPNIFGRVLSDAGMRQLRIAETEKYAHVTFFFNGQRETPFAGEERILVPSPRDVDTYDQKPAMSAPEVAERFTEAILSGRFDAAVCNFANPDMMGHTGDLDAATEAVRIVDGCLGAVLDAIRQVNGAAIVTADHGNAEEMLNQKTGEPHTAHTANPVPLILVDPRFQGRLRRDGRALCDVAPTLLGLIGIPKPPQMTGQDLRVSRRAPGSC